MQTVYILGAVVTFSMYFFFLRKLFPRRYTFFRCLVYAIGWPVFWVLIFLRKI